jgi:N-acetyl sugar amidotransferase
MSISNLVIFVSDYPYGPGEPFLEEELRIISKDFNKIYLVNFHLNNNNNNNKPYEFYVPENAKVISAYKGKRFRNLKSFISFAPIFEIFLAVVKHKRKLSFSLVKLIYYYWTEGVRDESAILSILKTHQINPENTMFYSYWCDTNCVSLANISKQNKSFNYLTRLHGWDLYYERHQINFLPFRERIFNNSYKVLPISKDGRKYILDNKLSIDKQKVTRAYLGVADLELNVNYKNEVLVDKKILKIITISHINPVKSLFRLVEALSLINDYEVVWTLIGYGDGVFDVEFKKQAANLLTNKKNITIDYRGKLPKELVFEIIQNEPFDVIVNCSKAEGIPVSLMEAMSAGIPGIAFNVGGIPELIKDRFNGFLLDHVTENHSLLLKETMDKFFILSSEDKMKFSSNARLVWSDNFNSKVNYNRFSKMLKREIDIVENAKISCDKCLIDSEIYPEILLDKYGTCDICNIIIEKHKKLEAQKNTGYLENLLKDLEQQKGKNKYDCILGISGGIDSAYLAIKAKEWGLNPLLVHIDTGWNSELAVDNIKSLINQLGFDLYTVVVDWTEIQDVVRAFMRASVIDIDWANELSAQASLNIVAKKFKIKHILTGHQVATEGWMPSNIVHYKLDLINFKAIHKRFGGRKLKTYPTIGLIKTYYYEKIAKIRYYNPLDFITYIKQDVKKILIDQYGWRDYGHKHYENIFTRFYQGYILPHKFNVDKRVFHYSALIVSGQLTKDEAKEMIAKNPYDNPQQLIEDKAYVIKKLGFSEEEFEQILNAAPKKHTDYPSYINILNRIKRILNLIRNNK